MGPRVAVFDLIGTTVRAGDEVPRALDEVFRERGVRLTDEDVLRIRGRSKREAVEQLVALHLSADADTAGLAHDLHARFVERLERLLAETAVEMPGASEVLDALRASGVTVVLTTGLGRDTARTLISTLGWRDRFAVLSGDDVVNGRPAPDLIHAAMRLASVEDSRRVLSVGDTESDLIAAAAADVGWSVGVCSGAHPRERLERHPHSVLLESVADLPAWLAESVPT